MARRYLIQVICDAYGTTFLYRSTWVADDGRVLDRQQVRVELWGREDSMHMVEMVYVMLDAQAARHMKGIRSGNQGATLSDRRSWLFGFAEGIGDRLDAVNADIDREGDGRLLPMLKSDADLARDKMTEMYPKLKMEQSAVAPVTEAAWDGMAAAERADIGSGQVASPAAPKAIER